MRTVLFSVVAAAVLVLGCNRIAPWVTPAKTSVKAEDKITTDTYVAIQTQARKSPSTITPPQMMAAHAAYSQYTSSATAADAAIKAKDQTAFSRAFADMAAQTSTLLKVQSELGIPPATKTPTK